MTLTIRRSSLAVVAGVLVAFALACSERPVPMAPVLADATAAPTTQATSYSGQATVVQATLPLVGAVTLVNAGPLPPSGGAEDSSLVNASVSGLLTAEVLHASTVGQGNASRSEASVAELTLTAGGQTIRAGFLEARATARCTDNGATASGSSDIAALTLNDTTITISGTPNQTITLPAGLGVIIINEQTSARPGDITVNALHIRTVDGTDVIVSSAHADITCQPAPAPPPPPPPGCTPADFVTGGGWITPSGAKANFGVGGGIKHGAFWGHLTYIDHGANGPTVKGTGVTGYAADPDPTLPTMRHIQGTAEVNGVSGFTYQVDVADNGEPGRNDTFTITLSNGYRASGTLDGGGNIQLHTPACQ